jgi:hypothetical protein
VGFGGAGAGQEVTDLMHGHHGGREAGTVHGEGLHGEGTLRGRGRACGARCTRMDRNQMESCLWSAVPVSTAWKYAPAAVLSEDISSPQTRNHRVCCKGGSEVFVE